MAGVEIKVRANATQARRELHNLEKSVGNIEKTTRNVSKAFRNLAIGITAAFGAVGAVRSVTRASDAMISFNNRINLVTKDADKTRAVLDRLFKIAENSGGSVDAAAETFNRFGLALQDSNKPIEELLTVTQAVQKAAVISGSGAESAKAAIIQLGQGLASGQLRGQELNSVLEQMPRLARAIADGMGIPFGELREKAAEGKITAESVFAAILDGAKEIDNEFSGLEFTVADLATVMGDRFRQAVAELDKVINVSGLVRKAIKGLTAVFKGFSEGFATAVQTAKINFLIFAQDIKFLSEDISTFLGNMFTGNIDATALVENTEEAISKVKERLKGSASIALTFSVQKIDLAKNFILNDLDILGRLTKFKDNVISIFHALWSRIVGDSLWTGIFDPSHEEGGAASIGNVSAWGAHLNSAVTRIKSFSGEVIAQFKDLNTKVIQSYNDLTINIGGRTFESPNIDTEAIKQSFADTTQFISENFTTTTEKMQTNFDKLKGTIEDKAGFTIPSFSELEVDFDHVLERLRASYDAFLATLKTTPIFIAADTLTSSLINQLPTTIEEVKQFFTDNAGVAGVALSSAITLAFSSRARGLISFAAFATAFAAAAGTLGDSQEFIDAVRNTTRTYTDLFVKFFTSDGDFVSRAAAGLGNILQAAGQGIVEGLFGDKFSENVTETLGGVLAAGIVGALVFTKLLGVGGMASAIATFGISFGRALFGVGATAALRSNLATAIVGAVQGIGTNTKVSQASTLSGKQISKGIGKGFKAAMPSLGNLMNAGIAQQISDIAIADDSFGGFGEAFDGAIGGAVLGASTGAMFGPLGAAVGGVVGGAIGFAFDVVNNAELRAKFSSIGEAIKQVFIDGWNVVVDGVAGIGSSLKEAFMSAASALNPFAKKTDNPNSVGAEDFGRKDGESFEDYKKRLGFAGGGFVRGSGTGTSDSIPAMLSNGEFVVKADSVRKIGLDRLNLLNQTGLLPRFNQGGLVGGTINRALRQINQAEQRGDSEAAKELTQALQDLMDITKEQVDVLKSEGTDSTAGKKIVADATDKTETKTIAQNTADSFVGDIKAAFSHAFKTGDFQGAIRGIIDSFTSKVVDNFTNSLVDKALGGINFGSIFAGVGGAGGGIGSFIGGLFGFSQGGVVPSTRFSQAGKDSVPALLTPGEVVLSKKDMANMNSNNSSSTQAFNINVSGDVSRQTRKEIVKMIPQITNGVNSQNKEQGVR